MIVSALEPAPVAGACSNCQYLYSIHLYITYSPEVSAEVNSAVLAGVNICVDISVGASAVIGPASRVGAETLCHKAIRS